MGGVNYISERDIQTAKDILRPLLSVQFRKAFFGSERLERLTRVLRQEIDSELLLDLIVRNEGAQLLASRPRRVGQKESSIRRRLLEELPEDKLRALNERLRGENQPVLRGTIERDLAEWRWHRGAPKSLILTRALGLPDAFAGIRERGARDAQYPIEPIADLPKLKAFQRGILKEIRSVFEKRPRIMVSCFTGTGKTRIGMEYAVEMLQGGEDGSTVVWIAQKEELLDQACDSIDELWPWLGVKSGQPLEVMRFHGGNKFEGLPANQLSLVVATAQQLIARLAAGDAFANQLLRRANLLVVDEAHHALAKGHKTIIDSYQEARVGEKVAQILGLSATPGRSNLFDPTESRQLAELFGQTLVVPDVEANGSALAWFQNEGYLSRIKHRAMPAESQIAQTLGKLKNSVKTDQSGYKDFTSEFLEVVGEDSVRNRAILQALSALHAEGRQMLVFCCNITQAEILAQGLLVQGISAGLIHHKIDRRDRHHTIQQFRKGEIRTLFNVEVLTTGFDAPKVDTIVMCRPTLSRILYEQMVGRGMRGPEMRGTANCEIIDFTTNFGRFELPMAWEAFWEEWNRPEKGNVAHLFGDQGWKVFAAEPEDETSVRGATAKAANE